MLSEIPNFRTLFVQSDILEMKKTFTDIWSLSTILSIPNQKFQQNPKMLTFDFSGLQIYLRPGKVPFATVQDIRLAR